MKKSVLILLAVAAGALSAMAAAKPVVLGNPWLCEAEGGSPAVYNLRFSFRTFESTGKYVSHLWKGTLIMTTNGVCRAWVWDSRAPNTLRLLEPASPIEPIYHICVWNPRTPTKVTVVEDTGNDAPMTALANALTAKKATRGMVRLTLELDGKPCVCCGAGTYKSVCGCMVLGDSAAEPGSAAYGTWRMSYDAAATKRQKNILSVAKFPNAVLYAQ